jgi:hypothetical protein
MRRAGARANRPPPYVVKLASEIGAIVVAVLDVVMGLAVAMMGFAEVASSA